jgi:hypothetical protein
MNDSTRSALDRLNRTIGRPDRKRKPGFSTSPLVLACALILGYHLLVRLVPSLWANILPGGFEQGSMFVGWPWIVWRLAWFCHLNFIAVAAGTVILVAIAIVLGRLALTKPIAWLMAVFAILLDAGILFIAIKAGMDAAGVGRVLG